MSMPTLSRAGGASSQAMRRATTSAGAKAVSSPTMPVRSSTTAAAVQAYPRPPPSEDVPTVARVDTDLIPAQSSSAETKTSAESKDHRPRSKPTQPKAWRNMFPDFTPRERFPLPSSIPRSYFLGHHRAGLEKMKTLLGSIDLVVECRDYRVPWTGRNILFEKELLGIEVADDGDSTSVGAGSAGIPSSSEASRAGAIGGTKRVVVFTKCDLGIGGRGTRGSRKRDEILRNVHHPTPVHFSSAGQSSSSYTSSGTIRALLDIFREHARTTFSLTGHRVLVAGMPNVGKSTLLNSLRTAGLPGRSKGKVAKTGAEPGVTRKVGTGVKILEAQYEGSSSDGDSNSVASNESSASTSPIRAQKASSEGVYLLDTPGVFMPYVPSALAMLKLALVGSVKDSLVPPVTLADFLLYNINARGDPRVYTRYTDDQKPTNDIHYLLEGIGKRIGRLGKGAAVDVEGAAVWFVQRWRKGEMGRFVLDDVVDGAEGWDGGSVLDDDGENGNGEERKGVVSISQARKLQKDRRKEAMKAKWTASKS